MKSLKERWGVFGDIVLDPFTLLLLGSLIALLAYSSTEQDTLSGGVLLIIITLTSSVLGGRLTKHWVDIHEGGVVVARGTTAVRGLKLLVGAISVLEKRVGVFLNNSEEIEKSPEVTKRNYEEILTTCNALQETALSSIENWTDIVPEADIKTQIGLYTEQQQQIYNAEKELEKLKGALVDSKGKSQAVQESLEEKVAEKEQKILDLNHQLLTNRVGLGAAGGSFLNRGIPLYESMGDTPRLTLDSPSFLNTTGSGLLDPESHTELKAKLVNDGETTDK